MRRGGGRAGNHSDNQPEQSREIVSRLVGELCQRQTLERRGLGSYRDDIRRFRSPAWDGIRIGLDEQALQREIGAGDGSAQAGVFRSSNWPANGDRAAEIEPAARLCRVAGEVMDHRAQPGGRRGVKLLRSRDRLLPLGVDHHRQAEIIRQAKLYREGVHLRIQRGRRLNRIEANLADSDYPLRRLRDDPQSLDIAINGGSVSCSEKCGMQPNGSIDAIVCAKAPGQSDGALRRWQIDAHRQECPYAHPRGPFEQSHRVGIGVAVEVDVAIDIGWYICHQLSPLSLATGGTWLAAVYIYAYSTLRSKGSDVMNLETVRANATSNVVTDVANDAGLLLLRGSFGSLMTGHGAQKLFGWFGGHGLNGTSMWLESMGFKPGKPWAIAAGVSELGGGLLTDLGLLHPLGPLLTLGSMGVATFKVHWGKPIWVSSGGAELPILNIAIATALSISGPGRYSLDNLLSIRLPRWLAIPGGVLAAAGVAYGVFFSQAQQAAEQAQTQGAAAGQAQQQTRASKEQETVKP